MARKLRLQYPGAIYHVLSRGDRREDIFRDDGDRERFLTTLAEACTKTASQVHAFCLMRNHFHLVIETPQANLVAGMKWLLGTYTTRFNRRHALVGHLFSGRYKSLLVGGAGGYLRTVCDYVHLNPARAGLLTPQQPLQSFPWSSLPLYLSTPPRRPAWLRVDRLLGECGIRQDTAAGRREFEGRLEGQREHENAGEFGEVRRGWCLGDDEFRNELLSQMSAKAGANHYGRELHEASEVKANRIVSEELQRIEWREADLQSRRKGAPEKIVIAQRLRRETTMTLQWVADRLRMGAKTHLSHLLYWQRRKPAELSVTPKTRASNPKKPSIRPVTTIVTSKPVTDELYLPRTDPFAVQFDTSFD